jgi:quercetin dioxygenase-like cupin family protein
VDSESPGVHALPTEHSPHQVAGMSDSFERPFHPVELSRRVAKQLPLGSMIDQLRGEESYRNASRNALTLVHDDGLAVVLTVARGGAECADHSSPEPSLVVSLAGELAIKSPSDEEILLPQGSAGTLGPDVHHRLAAVTDCAYLTIIGSRRETPRDASSESERTDVAERVEQLARGIERAPAADQHELRDYAVGLLTAEAPSILAPRRASSTAPMGALGAALLMIVASGVFFLVFPPVALVMFFLAFFVALVGIATAAFKARKDDASDAAKETEEPTASTSRSSERRRKRSAAQGVLP